VPSPQVSTWSAAAVVAALASTWLVVERVFMTFLSASGIARWAMLVGLIGVGGAERRSGSRAGALARAGLADADGRQVRAPRRSGGSTDR
jgi:hypothetical protein